MNIQIGDTLKIGTLNVEGVVEEVTENNVLVKQQVNIDGVLKTLKQWYDKDMITGIIETEQQESYAEAVDLVEELKKKGYSDQQIEDLAKYKEQFQQKIIELGIISQAKAI